MIIDATKSFIESKVEVSNLCEMFWPHIHTMRRTLGSKHWKKFREASIQKYLQNQGQPEAEFNIVFWQNSRVVGLIGISND